MAAPSPFYVNNSVNSLFWTFSSCSLSYFDAYINYLTAQDSNCMITRSTTFNTSALREYSNELLGQIYAPDDQCHLLYGDNATMCRSFYEGDYTSICDKMYCDANSTECWYGIPFDGTVCGNGKICRKGKCVTSTEAPTGLSDSCPHGDKPGIITYLYGPCIDILNTKSLHKYCYDAYYNLRCCETCTNVSKLYQSIPGCKFGDSEYVCDVSNCAAYDDNTCCSSCSKPSVSQIVG